jgi:hypothetical protein
LLLLSPVLLPPLLIAARALALDEDDIEGNNCVWETNLRATSIDQKLHEAEEWKKRELKKITQKECCVIVYFYELQGYLTIYI